MSARNDWGQRGRIALPQPQGVGPNGRPFCRLCHAEVPAGRKSWCSEECVREGWLKLSWPALRQHVIRRDRVCQSCHAEHAGYNFRARWYMWQNPSRGEHGPHRLPPLYAWEVDHITPVKDGGTDNPENLRLLCYACHKRVTRDWHRARSKKGAA